MPPAETIPPLIIRKSLTLAIAGIIVAGLFAVALAVVIAIATSRGRQVEAMAWLMIPMALGLAVWAGRDALDRRVLATLDAEGFRDIRTGGALTPWSAVRKAVAYSSGSGPLVEFEVGPEDARDVGADWLAGAGRHTTLIAGWHIVSLPLHRLDASPADVIAFVRRAAPHVAMP
jgi:hypothetical protein